MSTRRRQLTEAGIVVGDQAVNSVSNSLVTILVANLAALPEFGIFATAQLAVTTFQIVALAAIGDLWLKSDPVTRLARFAGIFRLFVLITVGFSVIAFALWAAGAPPVIAASLLAAPAIAGLDHLRLVLIATQRARKALLADLVFSGLQLAAVVVWSRLDSDRTASGAWLAWGASAHLALGLTMAVGSHSRGRVVGASPARITTVFSMRFALETALTSGAAQVSQLVCAIPLGATFNGMMRAAQIPFGPVVLLVHAARPLLIPSFRPERSGRNRLLLIALSLGMVVTAGCTLLALVLSQSARLSVVIGSVPLTPSFVALTGCSVAGAAAYTICYYYYRASGRPAAVTAGRLVFIGCLAVTTLSTLILRSPNTYLIGLTASWCGAVAAMFFGQRWMEAGRAALAQRPTRSDIP